MWQPSKSCPIIRLAHLCLLRIPLDAVLELDARTTKDIQCAANGKIHLALAQLLHQFQIFNRAASTGVRDGYAAPFRQLGNEFVVYTALQAFDVGGVDEELAAVGFEEGYRFYIYLLAIVIGS